MGKHNGRAISEIGYNLVAWKYFLNLGNIEEDVLVTTKPVLKTLRWGHKCTQGGKY